MRKLLYWTLFNVIVAAIAFASIAAMLAIGSRLVQPGDDFVEPLAMFAGASAFALLCNVALVAGIVHQDDEQFRQRFWRVLKWSAGFATAPIWIALVAAVLNAK